MGKWSSCIEFSQAPLNGPYNLLTDKFLGIVNKHAALKKKFVRGSNALFMNREFQNEIYVRSRLRNKYWVEPSAENKAAYKKQRNKCVKIRRKIIKRYINKVSRKVIETNKSFWNFIKPFMTNKGVVASNDMSSQMSMRFHRPCVKVFFQIMLKLLL